MMQERFFGIGKFDRCSEFFQQFRCRLITVGAFAANCVPENVLQQHKYSGIDTFKYICTVIEMIRREAAALMGFRMPTHQLIKEKMLIDLTQHTTRCSNRSNKSQKHLITGHAAVETEAELIQI